MWRRLASRTRMAAYRLVTPWSESAEGALLPRLTAPLLLPNNEAEAFARACQSARTELRFRASTGASSLDIGSGLAISRRLLGDLTGGYDGVEIHPEAVAWCQRAITRKHPQFRSITPTWQ